MGSVLSGILGTQNDFKANTGGQDFGQAIQQSQTNLNNNYQNQNTLAQALMQQASGGGPNPAQNMLNQATDNSIKQNTSMLASQKGINAGTTQRLASINAANQGQQMAGQAATMGAQQQLSAQGQLGGIYGQMGNQQLQSQQLAQGGLNATNQVNAGVANQNTATAGQVAGGLIQGGGAALALSRGGHVPGSAQVAGDSLANDIVDAKLSPGEIVIPRSKASDPTKAKEFIDHLMGSQKSKDSESGAGFGEIVKLKERIKALEKRVKA